MTFLAEMFCTTFKSIEFVCELIDFMSDEAFHEILKSKLSFILFHLFFYLKHLILEMKDFISNVEEIFYVSIHFEHHFDFDTNASKTFAQIHEDITTEINDKTSHALKFIESINVFLSFYFIYILIK
jgi:hypothetical protein